MMVTGKYHFQQNQLADVSFKIQVIASKTLITDVNLSWKDRGLYRKYCYILP